MPRGIPSAKKDETGMKYTTFHVPLALNPKHMASSYLKSESQTLWYRNSLTKGKAQAEQGPPLEPRPRGSQVIVIHPGSRFLRIGKASDTFPITVPNVVARKHKPPVPEPTFVEGIFRPGKQEESEEDVFETRINQVSMLHRERMRYYKLPITSDAFDIVSDYNAKVKSEIIPEHNDPFRTQWLDESCPDTVLFGEKALQLADPQKAGYVVRYPIHGSNFNTRDYPSIQVLLSDVADIISATLSEKLSIEPPQYKDYSIVLVIPDLYDRFYVKTLVDLLLVSMGFKQLCVQQEAMAATYGAGISSACVVDIGAKTTSISIVEEGLIMAESRLALALGGDDITECLYVLLNRVNFPYRDMDLVRSYDWNVMEELKMNMCTLAEGDVALNMYDFVVRQPGKPIEKYSLKAYDEVILAPMCFFETKMVDYDRKRGGLNVNPHPDVTEEILEHYANPITTAMISSTAYLMPKEKDEKGSNPSGTDPDVPADQSQSGGDVSMTDGTGPPAAQAEDEKQVPMTDLTPTPKPTNQNTPEPPSGGGPDFGGIDVLYEATKLPLDVAVYHSICTQPKEKISKYLQAVLLIGGGSLLPGVTHALQSRLQSISVFDTMKVQIIPPPKDVDPRVLTWKGAAVLGKMEGASDLWVTTSDWDMLGMRGLRERCFYLQA